MRRCYRPGLAAARVPHAPLIPLAGIQSRGRTELPRMGNTARPFLQEQNGLGETCASYWPRVACDVLL